MIETDIVAHDLDGKHESYKTCECEQAKAIREKLSSTAKQEVIEPENYTALDGILTEEEMRFQANEELGLLADMTPEQKVAHYHKMTRIMKCMKIRVFAAYKDIERTKKALSEENLKKLAEYEKSYKPLKPSPNERAVEEKKAAKKRDRSIEVLASSLGLSEAQAIALKERLENARRNKERKNREIKAPAERKSASERAAESISSLVGSGNKEAFKAKLEEIRKRKEAERKEREEKENG